MWSTRTLILVALVSYVLGVAGLGLLTWMQPPCIEIPTTSQSAPHDWAKPAPPGGPRDRP